MPSIFFFFFFFKKKDIYIYIFRFGGKGKFFFLFGFDKMGSGEFLNAVPQAFPMWDSYLRGECPTRLGVPPPPQGPPFPVAPSPFL